MTSAPLIHTPAGSLPGSIHHTVLRQPSGPQLLLTRKVERDAKSSLGERITLGGVPVALLDFDAALEAILAKASKGGPLPLGIASANLDHIKHFGQGSRWVDTLERQRNIEWLTLLDGAPLVTRARAITERTWPRLAGSDLIGPVLTRAEEAGLRIGFLGGTPQAHLLVRDNLARAHPGLAVAGWWAPERSSLANPAASGALAGEIAEARADILVVCLGKPRQELWVSEFGQLTGAKVILAFGAVVDFLAGTVPRAPEQVRNLGMEWAWRLALEPRRLANRYLVDGPEAYLKLRQSSWAGVPAPAPVVSPPDSGLAVLFAASGEVAPALIEGFSAVSEHAKVAVLVVTYNNDKDMPALLETLRAETRDQTIKVIVADNSPTAATLDVIAGYHDVLAFSTGGNLGYAGAINAAMSRAGDADAYLVLNPDTRVEPGSVRALRNRMASAGAGVVVPLLLDDDGSVYPSLRREPSVCRAIGDALMGSRVPGRPGWLSEMDYDAESYQHPHKVDWATGAALLIRQDVAATVGHWDENYFLYSEETDFMHRVRAAGAELWFEPAAKMTHARGGSGSSPRLDALMATNRIRYVRKFHSGGYAQAFRAAVVLSALLRAPLSGQVEVLATVAHEKRWERLPHATRDKITFAAGDFPAGSVVIPAHNEASVLRRTLEALAVPLASGAVEVIVACNGCTDGTEAIAESFAGVQVLRVAEASKVAALNAADRVATLWPRVYLDADIELPAEALRGTLDALSAENGALAARPAFTYDTEGASRVVSAYYRARNRLPQASASMWGAGVYGLTQRGHERLGRFPSVTADDCYVDRLFVEGEKVVLDCPPVVVRTPRSAKALLNMLRRVYRGNGELRDIPGSHTRRTLQELARSGRGPASSFDSAVYAAFALAGRRRPRGGDRGWERDNTSRL